MANTHIPLSSNDIPSEVVYTPGVGTSAVEGGTQITDALGNTYAPLIIEEVVSSGYVAVYASNPATLTANTDAAFKWGTAGTTQVNHVMIQNNTALNVNWDLDVATSAGSPILAPGQTLFLDVQTTAVHVQTNGTPNLNGATAGNVVVRGWL